MTVNEYRQQVYRVMVTVLAIPDANPRIIAEKCNLSLPDLWTTLEFTDTEGLLSSLRIQHGGQGKAPIMVFYDTAQRTLKGMEFMEQFETQGIPHLHDLERQTVFISYNQGSASDFVDELEKRLAICADVKRDKTTMDSWDSFSEFMRSIRKQDFAVLVITDAYLKSIPCMFEVSELMKDDNWRQKVMFAVLDSNLYSAGADTYIRYWQDKKDELNGKAKGIDPVNMAPITADLKKVVAIQQCFGDFFMSVCDSDNPKPYLVIEAIIGRIRKEANGNFVDTLNSSDAVAESMKEKENSDLEKNERGLLFLKSEKVAGKNIVYCPTCYTKYHELYMVTPGSMRRDLFCTNCKAHF